MGLYNFTDINESGNTISLPTEAFTFNDHVLDVDVEGFRTLIVTGRDDVSTNIELFEGVDRDTFRHAKYVAGEIEVNFQLTSNTYYEQQQQLVMLKRFLYGNDVSFSFADEDYNRRGTVSSFKINNTGSLSLTGTIGIKQTNPWKYLPSRTHQGIDKNGTKFIYMLDPELIYHALPKKIMLRNGSSAQKIRIVNNTTPSVQEMTFSQAVPANALVIIDFDNLEITVNGNTNPTSGGWVTLHSDFGTMKFEQGAILSVAGVDEFELTYEIEVL